jgi:hypothetical protein
MGVGVSRRFLAVASNPILAAPLEVDVKITASRVARKSESGGDQSRRQENPVPRLLLAAVAVGSATAAAASRLRPLQPIGRRSFLADSSNLWVMRF